MEWIKRTLALGFVLYAVLAPTAQGADPKKVIVFDLDGVVLFHPGPDSPPSKTVKVNTNVAEGGDTAAKVDTYRVIDGFPELLASLERSGYTVHVFSFGGKTRNEGALKAIQLPDGRSALDVVKATGGKVFSSTDGLNLDPADTRTEFDYSLPAAKRPKVVKSLAKVLGPEVAKNAILVEDIPKNAAPDERETHLVYLPYRWVFNPAGEEVKFLETFAPTEKALRERGEEGKIPAARQRFDRLHGRMTYLAGLLAKAEDRATVSGRTIPEELADLQFQRDRDGKVIFDGEVPRLNEGLLDDPRILARGRERLKERPAERIALPLLKGGDRCLLALERIA